MISQQQLLELMDEVEKVKIESKIAWEQFWEG